MESNYAYVVFTEGINETEEAKSGELIQLNYPYIAGETDLMSVVTYERLKGYFPDRINGIVIKKEKLISALNYLYVQLKDEIAALPELSDNVNVRFETLKTQFERNGVLKPDHDTPSSINDLVEKFIALQDQVRKSQREYLVNINHR